MTRHSCVDCSYGAGDGGEHDGDGGDGGADGLRSAGRQAAGEFIFLDKYLRAITRGILS